MRGLILLMMWMIPLFSVYAQTRSDRLKILENYANHMLLLAKDNYSGKDSPLLANGIRVSDNKPLVWKNGDGSDYILSNFSAQQNFMRFLVGLTTLTKEAKYRKVAEANVCYYFDHYQDEGGLLYWGGHRFIDLSTLKPVGVGDKNLVHELKNAYPYYDLMFDVDAKATTHFIEGLWHAHVYNWKEMETSRHGLYGLSLPKSLWSQKSTQLEPWYETKGLSFLNAGNDLIYAASILAKRTNQPQAQVWAEHLAYQYVYPRDTKTGLGVYQFTKPLKRDSTKDDSDTNSKYGDRAERQFGPEFGSTALEGNMLLSTRAGTIYSENALMQLQLAKELGQKQGANFHKWTVDGLIAFSKYAYDPASGKFRPMIADGTDLSNYVLPRDGYYGKKGTVLKQYDADSKFLLSFSRAYTLNQSKDLWQVIRGLAKGEDLGDVGSTAGKDLKLNFQTKNHSPYAIFVLIDLYTITKDRAYLQLADAVANNIMKQHYVAGFFLDHLDSQWANIDSIYPYALLTLEAAYLNRLDEIAPFINGAGFTEGEFRLNDGKIRVSTSDQHIFALRGNQELSSSRH
ncbi:hypothetical protein PVA45_07405 (plasmid) [Entomospira entomophila]|uniref:Pectate lyase n=1 Tax=Entomospira entomophila TaxID=2719988 RepID=A0A968GF54_9SPIO|nr:pectate lyase [Entomospira entomophilus]NIZ41314.1 pectate lyase [Entomospira entomophilus]WDI36163.1 hypothetical protein PVA45_07405 [Entomospira entomophilus]